MTPSHLKAVTVCLKNVIDLALLPTLLEFNIPYRLTSDVTYCPHGTDKSDILVTLKTFSV